VLLLNGKIMELLNDFANMLGFKHFFGMCMLILWLAFWLFLGIGFHYANKPSKSK
jgi:hypothetical protein